MIWLYHDGGVDDDVTDGGEWSDHKILVIRLIPSHKTKETNIYSSPKYLFCYLVIWYFTELVRKNAVLSTLQGPRFSVFTHKLCEISNHGVAKWIFRLLVVLVKT